jgi:EmrB/QacA subfamily drug resistance transporter
MIALDATIMNVALPSVQADLGFSDADRQWVITAYTLTFGALLLLGGRIADSVGRIRAFVIGLTGFSAASAAAGMATSLSALAAARAAQGAFTALLAPTVLSLIAVTFIEPRERARAFAVFGAIAGVGGATGLVLGGALTEMWGWRACLLVNVPIALVASVGAWSLRESAPVVTRPSRGRLDVVGAMSAVAGLVAVALGCAQAAAHGWRSPPVLGLLAAGLTLLGGFVWWESRMASPMLPPRILLDRNRAGANLAVALTIAALLGAFLLLTYYLQVVRGYDPFRAGLAFLPLSAAVLASSQLTARLVPRLPLRALAVPGLLVAACGMALLTKLSTDSAYLTAVLPAEILIGLGVGAVFTPAINAATSGVDQHHAGIAAAVVNTAQQVGGSVGVATLNSVAAITTSHSTPGRPPSTAALVHGYSAAAAVAGAILVAAAALAAVLITQPSPSVRNAQ